MRTRAVIGLAAVVAFGLVVYLLREVMLPFVAGIALAYLLDPLADRLERLGLGRLAASLMILALFVVGAGRDAADRGAARGQQVAPWSTACPAWSSRLQAIIAERAAGRCSSASAAPTC